MWAIQDWNYLGRVSDLAKHSDIIQTTAVVNMITCNDTLQCCNILNNLLIFSISTGSAIHLKRWRWLRSKGGFISETLKVNKKPHVLSCNPHVIFKELPLINTVQDRHSASSAVTNNVVNNTVGDFVVNDY